jgi:hypothetical protein
MLAISIVTPNRPEDKGLAELGSPPLDGEDITGIYRCTGDGADKQKYEGVVKIEKNGRSYNLTWIIPGTEPYIGVGIRTGDVLAVSCATQMKQGIGVSVVVYEISKGPRLSGRFTSLGGDGTIQSETLTLLRRLR